MINSLPGYKRTETMAAATEEEKQNGTGTARPPGLVTDIASGLSKSPPSKSPSLLKQAVRVILFVVWFNTACLAIVATQFIGAPIALCDKNMFNA